MKLVLCINMCLKHLLNTCNVGIIFFLSQTTDGSASNVDITAPGAIIALTLMYLKVGLEDSLTR